MVQHKSPQPLKHDLALNLKDLGTPDQSLSRNKKPPISERYDKLYKIFNTTNSFTESDAEPLFMEIDSLIYDLSDLKKYSEKLYDIIITHSDKENLPDFEVSIIQLPDEDRDASYVLEFLKEIENQLNSHLNPNYDYVFFSDDGLSASANSLNSEFQEIYEQINSYIEDLVSLKKQLLSKIQNLPPLASTGEFSRTSNVPKNPTQNPGLPNPTGLYIPSPLFFPINNSIILSSDRISKDELIKQIQSLRALMNETLQKNHPIKNKKENDVHPNVEILSGEIRSVPLEQNDTQAEPLSKMEYSSNDAPKNDLYE